MKYLLCTNSLDTRTSALDPIGNPVSPATYQSPTNFVSNFNTTIELPEDCQMCIISSKCVDASTLNLHYVQCPSLPFKTFLGNGAKGGEPPILGAIESDSNIYGTRNWLDLENPSPLIITSLQFKVVDADGFEASGLTDNMELLIGYRKRPE